jgi:hypothetical protein
MNSIVLNGNGVGFLADPAQLTALFSPLGAGSLNYSMQTTLIPIQIDEAGNLVMESTWENDQGRPPHLTEDEIAQLPVETYHNETSVPEACIVCQNIFQNTDPVTKLECNHYFHMDCIRPWLQRVNTCPVCRKIVVPLQENEQERNILASAFDRTFSAAVETEDEDIPEPPSP